MNARPMQSQEEKAANRVLTMVGRLLVPLMLSSLFGVSGWLISEAFAARELRQNAFTKLEAAELRRTMDGAIEVKTAEIKESQSQIRSDLEVIKAILMRIEKGM